MAETLGFVQRVKWNSAASTAFFNVGPTATSTTLLFAVLAENDTESALALKRSLVQAMVLAQLAGSEVSVMHPDTGGEVTQVEMHLRAQNTAVPAFWPAQSPLFDLLQQSALPGAIIVLDPDIANVNVTDPVQQTYWQGVVRELQTPKPGGTRSVLGYVYTGAGSGAPCPPGAAQGPGITPRSLAEVEGEVDRWKMLCPKLDGIFFDVGPEPDVFTGTATLNGPIAQCVKDFYGTIYQYAKTAFAPARPGHPVLGGNPDGTVFLNASQYEPDDGGWIMDGPSRACDVANLWEVGIAAYTTTQPRPTNVYPSDPPSWWTDTRSAPYRIAHVVYSVPDEVNQNQADMRRVVALSRQRLAGYVFVYDGTPAAYDHLPPYWAVEVAALDSP